jgi:hypothetical protein
MMTILDVTGSELKRKATYQETFSKAIRKKHINESERMQLVLYSTKCFK